MIHFDNFGVRIWHMPNLSLSFHIHISIFQLNKRDTRDHWRSNFFFWATCCGRLLRSSKVYHTSFFDPNKEKKKEKKNLETCAIPGMSHVSKSPTKATRKFGQNPCRCILDALLRLGGVLGGSLQQKWGEVRWGDRVLVGGECWKWKWAP